MIIFFKKYELHNIILRKCVGLQMIEFMSTTNYNFTNLHVPLCDPFILIYILGFHNVNLVYVINFDLFVIT